MIAFLRNLLLEDFWLKLFSLALAALIWFTVTFVSQKEVRTDTRVFFSLPVTVLSAAEDVRNFKVSPSEVQVTVQGDGGTLQNLQSKDIRATVDLSGVAAARELRKRIQVSAPAGVTYLRVVPQEVQVIFPPDR
jgi:hypothetical protein